MSTRMSLWYRGQAHLYVEMTTDWVHFQWGDWLNVRLWKRLRGIYWPHWLGRFACRRGAHDWFIEQGFWERTDRQTTYRCLRCSTLSDPEAQEEGR